MKQLNILTTIITFSCLSDWETMHQVVVQMVLGSILGSDKKYF